MIGLLSALRDFSDNRFFVKLPHGQGNIEQLADLCHGQSGCLVAHFHTQFDQEVMREHGHGHMMMPTRPTADFVMVHAQFGFAFLVGLLDRPAHRGQASQCFQRGVGGRIAPIGFQDGFTPQAATEHEPFFAPWQAVFHDRDADCGQVGDQAGLSHLPAT